MSDEELVALANPLSSDMDVLRPTLLPGLLNILVHNGSWKNHDVALFEIGLVFRSAESFVRDNPAATGHADKAVLAPREERRVAIALTGQRALPFWSGSERGAKFDACDLKGL